MADRQDRQEQEHYESLLELGAKYEAAELLEHAHPEAGRDHARQVAETGGGDDHEEADRIGRPEKRLHVPDHGDEGPGRAANRRVQAKGERIDLLGVDAEHTGRSGVLRGRADRLSHAALLHEENNSDGKNDREREADNAGGGDRDQPVRERQCRQIGLCGLRVGTEGKVQALLDHNGDAERRQQ